MPKVRNAVRLIESDGWFLVRTRGSHRQFKNENKTGLVTIAGSPGDDLPLGTWNSILKAGWFERGREILKYTVVFEKAPKNYAAYVPDLPGCIATGRTRGQVERNIREAVAFHLEGLRAEGEPVPEPTAWTELVEA